MPNITKRYIDAARYKGDGESRDERWDDGLPGFGLRISPKGLKSFILFYRVGGKRGAVQRLIKLGTYGRDMTPDEARRKAGRWLNAARDGQDPYGDIDEAISRANELPFAFQSAVCTQDIDVAMRCFRRLNASAVMVNDHTAFRVDWMPFAGRRQSGYGVGGIGHTMHDMTQEKMAVIKL